jgi:hypothetical protein
VNPMGIQPLLPKKQILLKPPKRIASSPAIILSPQPLGAGIPAGRAMNQVKAEIAA